MTSHRTGLVDAECPVTRTVDIVGDRWTLLILRDVFDGITRFSALQRDLGVARNILTERLRLLVERDVLETVPASDGTSYREYRLTARGSELFSVIVALRQWGEDHLFDEGEPHSSLVDRRHGRPLRTIALLDAEGDPVQPQDTFVQKVTVADAAD